MGACTRSTCRGGKKRQYCCCTRSSSIAIAKRQYAPRPHAQTTTSIVATAFRDEFDEVKKTTMDDQTPPHPDWSDISSDVLEHTCRWLSLADILRCRAVCSWWRRCIIISQTPHMMISSSLTSSATTPPPPSNILWCQPHPNYQHWFLDLAKDAPRQFYLPNSTELKQYLNQITCVGYSFGFFLSVNKNNRLCLLRPPLFSTLCFPPISLPGKKNYGFGKAVLWADPISDTSRCGVVIVPYNNQQLRFAKCGDTRFSKLECQEPKRRPCKEIICINNRVYGISSGGKIDDHHMEAWDCTDCVYGGPKKILDFQPAFSSGSAPPLYSSFYLVESRGELLLVAVKRPMRNFFLKYPTCMVYKMDFKEKKWVQMNSLGDHALFIFEYQTMCLSTQEFPQYQKNTIYFRNCNLGIYTNPRLGIFNMEDGSLKEIYPKC